MDTTGIECKDAVATGHAVIQLTPDGQNAIFLFPGANHSFDQTDIDGAADFLETGDWALTQNETLGVGEWIKAAHESGCRVCFNPAPCTDEVKDYPLNCVHCLVVNETEAEQLSGTSTPENACQKLAEMLPQDSEIVLTLGPEGVLVRNGSETSRIPPIQAQPVDTTAAGDTFIGFYMAERLNGAGPETAAQIATRAATACITRAGAMASIPLREEVV